MGDVIEYYIVLSIEDFKKTLENTRPARALKPCSKSGKMILKRLVHNIKTYESAISQFENIIVKLGVCGKIISSRVGVKLFPQLEKRNFITVNINGRVQANSLSIAFAYVVSLLEGKKSG